MINKVLDFIGTSGIIILGSLLLFTLAFRFVNYKGIQEREHGLATEFQAIVHPDGAQQLSYRMKHNLVRRWIVSSYKSELQAGEVEKYYEEELSKLGWTKQDVSKEAYEAFHYSKYRKEDYEIIIRPHQDYWVI